MKNCPSCRARLKDATRCPRCKADLEDIIRVQHLATIWQQQAIDFYLKKNIPACIDALDQALQLCHSDSAMAFKAFVLHRQKQTAWDRLKGLLEDHITRSEPVINDLLNKLSEQFDVLKARVKKQGIAVLK